MEGESWIRELTLSQCRIRRSILEGLSHVGFDFVRDKAFRRRKNAAEAGSCFAFGDRARQDRAVRLNTLDRNSATRYLFPTSSTCALLGQIRN